LAATGVTVNTSPMMIALETKRTTGMNALKTTNRNLNRNKETEDLYIKSSGGVVYGWSGFFSKSMRFSFNLDCGPINLNHKGELDAVIPFIEL